MMNIDKLNGEGYSDPTPYEALNAVMKDTPKECGYRPLVYICSPYAGDVEGNVSAAQRYSRFAVIRGYLPITPHLLFPQFLDDSDPYERKLGMKLGNILMSKCSEVWVFGARISEGMEKEIKRAKRKKYPIRYFTRSCEEVQK